MTKHGLLGRTTLLFVLIGMTGCAGQAPPTSAGAAPGEPAAPGVRHLMTTPTGEASFSSIVASLPSSVPVAEAKATMDTISEGQVAPLATSGAIGMMAGGFDVRGGFGNTWGFGFGGLGHMVDAHRIATSYAPEVAANLGALSFYRYGNLRFPYAQVGGTMQPFVVGRQQIPFFVEKTTLAIPRVTQVEREIDVPRTVTMERQVTVPQMVNVPRQVTVNEPQIVGVQTTVPYQTTVLERQTVTEPRIEHTLAETTSVVGAGASFVPMTYWR